MEKLIDHQKKILPLRNAFAKASEDLHDALQSWSFGGEKPAEIPGIETLMTKKSAAAKNLDDATRQLSDAVSPQNAVEQIDGSIPFLLCPLRIETRWVIVKHVIKSPEIKDIVDLSTVPRIGEQLKQEGFIKDVAGNISYSLPSLHRIFKNTASVEIPAALKKPPAGKYIRRKNDVPELRIRFYPDEVSVENGDAKLQPGEWANGELFWRNICSGKDPQEEWIQLTLKSTAPRAAWIARCTTPQNYTAGAALPAQPLFPTNPKLKDGAYTSAPSVTSLPDRFVVRLYRNNSFREFTGNSVPQQISTSIDPTADPFNKSTASGMQDDGRKIQTPDYLKWIHDFDDAEKNGLAIRINLQDFPEFKDGVDKIIATGLKYSADEKAGTAQLETLLMSHKYQETGMKLIAKGTPTNTVKREGDEQSRLEEEAILYFKSDFGKIISVPNSDEFKLKLALGIDKNFPFPSGKQMELNDASLFNQLFWPATWGYYLLQFFSPAIDEPTRNTLKKFFVENVSGRGTLPVLKINRQPYGIVLSGSLSDWDYAANTTIAEEKVFGRLWKQFLTPLIPLWKSASAGLENLNNTITEAGIDEKFLKMIGTTAITGKMQRSWMAGVQFLSVLQQSRSAASTGAIIEDPLFQPALVERTMLSLNMNMSSFPQATRNYQAAADLQVDFPAGKKAGIPNEQLKKIEGTNLNYLEWLSTAKIMDIWENRHLLPDGTINTNVKPTLFEQFCRQSLLRTVLETGVLLEETNEGKRQLKSKDYEAMSLHQNAIEFDAAAVNSQNLFLQNFKDVVDKYAINGSISIESDRKKYLQKKFSFTGDLSFADWIDKNKANKITSPAKDAYDAIKYLSKLPLQQLENLFGEHVDLCSHRLDAWISGIFQQRLNANRKKKASGIYLGAYGYLLQSKPSSKAVVVIKEVAPEYTPLTPENLSAAAIPMFHSAQAKINGITATGKGWNKVFFYLGESQTNEISTDGVTDKMEPLPGTNKNQSDGFIHAPSLEHAATAAIMRNGYLSHRNDDKTSLLSVQINAERSRQAMNLLEGMQQGIALGTLLGYFVERKLHEFNADHVLQDLRNIFPVHIKEAGNSGTSPMTTIDGIDLLKRKRSNPTGWLNAFPKLLAAKATIEKIATILESQLDALNDLLLTESVFQTVKGNKSRMAAPLRTLNNAGVAATPEFIKYPQKGKAIVQRAAIVFPATATSAWTKKGNTRSVFSPQLNQWLGQRLPSPEKIIAVVKTKTGLVKFSIADLDISPYDFILSYPESLSSSAECALSLAIQLAVIKTSAAPLPTAADQFIIDYKDRSKLLRTEISLFECASLVYALKKLVQDCRSVLPEDFMVPAQKSAYQTIKSEKLVAVLKTNISAAGPFGKIAKTLDTQIKALQTAVNTRKTGAALETPLKNLLTTMHSGWQTHLSEIFKPSIFILNEGNISATLDAAVKLKSSIETNLAKANELSAAITAGTSATLIVEKLTAAVEALVGNSIKITPEILPDNFAELKTVMANRNKISGATASDLDNWLCEASLVRKNLYTYRSALNLAETLTSTNISPAVLALQLPFKNEPQQWIGGKIGEQMLQPQAAQVSMVLETDDAFKPDRAFTGILLDEWPEWIPGKSMDTGVGIQYDQPGTEPPQALIMAIHPKTEGNWKWEYLIAAVDDALELAKIRLARPETIETLHPGIRHLLPAVILPFAQNNTQTVVTQKI